MGNSEDFYLRFTSIQILISLCNSQPFQLQSAVLNSPSGVEKVLNLLKDSREIVRNEGLLLCGALVHGNSDLQKILAFQGAFEEVMKIIVEEEGPWTGPLIIKDSFNLISSMLNLNTSNQNYFRDSICFKQLAGLLSEEEKYTGLWNSTRISNYLAALNVLDGILCKENVDLEASQV
jgi:intracellular protein transport protein USO1